MLLCPITSIGFIGLDCLFARRIWDSQKWVSRNYMRQSELGSVEVLDFLGGERKRREISWPEVAGFFVLKI